MHIDRPKQAAAALAESKGPGKARVGKNGAGVAHAHRKHVVCAPEVDLSGDIHDKGDEPDHMGGLRV